MNNGDPTRRGARISTSCATSWLWLRGTPPLRATGCFAATVDAGDHVGYTARIADPDGHSLELSFGQEVWLTVR